ncbi:MAG: peptidase M3, partial [Alphaproteobacteria bacterium]|nr:peptidase M3 [Alphaproteobacteria bacterium]
MGTDAAAETNPLLAPWTGPFEAPPFARLKTCHFEEAFETAFTRAKAEVAAIAEKPAAPTFGNTIEALEKSSADLTRVAAVFFNLASADTNEALQAIEREIAPKLARHRSEIYLNESLFQRIAALHSQRDSLGLSAEQRQVLERYHIAFLRNGGGLSRETKERLAAIQERLARLGTSFGQNVLSDEKDYLLVLESEADLAGLPASLIAAAAQTAADRGLPGSHAISLARSSIEPFLQFSARRDLREKVFAAWAQRGEKGGA